MSSTVKTNSLKINIMPEIVHDNYIENNLINSNELYLVEDNSLMLLNTGTIVSQAADYSEVGMWSDGNPDNENRIGYFVAIDTNSTGITMVKATSTSDVRGVTMQRPAFAANASSDKFDENENLLPQYDYVAFIGFVPVIDNGRCHTINSRCMPGDDGTAVPSTNNLGYQVIDIIDSTHVLILVEPQADMMIRIKEDVVRLLNNKQDNLSFVTNADIDAMFAGTYEI